MFKKYHYLSSELSNSSKCFCMTVNDKIAGFLSIIHFPHPIKSYKKVHRLVILPDYQGIGLGKIFLNEIAKFINYPFAITTSQPALINSLKKDVNWALTHYGRGKQQTGNLKMLNKTARTNVNIATFVYKGNK